MAAEPLRVAFFLPSFPELSTTFILNQIRGLIDRGHDVDLFAKSTRPFDTHHDLVERYRLRERMRHVVVPRGRLPRLGSAVGMLATRTGRHRGALDALDPSAHGRDAFALVAYHSAVSFVRSHAHDVVHAQFGDLGPALARLRRFGAIDAPIVTSFRGSDLTTHVPAAPARFADLFAEGDLFLPVSAAFGDRLVSLGVPEERVHVLRSGIDIERFAFAPRRRHDGPTTLLCVGRLTEKKGFEYAIDALAMLRADGRDAELVVIGAGPLGDALRSRAESLGVGDRVAFLGSRSHGDVVEAMHAAHILVAPSVTAANGDQEGIPNVVKEAMATGMPVVSTVHSGIPELVDHGVNGVLVPERDAAALTRELAALVDHPERWVPMGEAGRRKVRSDYDMEALNDDLVNRYRATVATYRARRATATQRHRRTA